MLAFSRDCWQAGITPRLPQYGFTRNTEQRRNEEKSRWESSTIDHSTRYCYSTTNFLQQHANSIFHEIFIREESHTREENLAKRTSLSWHAQAYLYLYIVRALYLHTRLEQSDKSFHNFSERTKRGKGSNYVCQGGSSNTLLPLYD